MSTIEKELKKGLIEAGNRFKGDQRVEKFVQTSNEFNDLVRKGIAQKRGNNLLSLSDKEARSKIIFNSQA